MAARDEVLGKVNGNPKFLYAMMEGLAEAPQLRPVIDREQARTLSSFEAISSALSTAFGSSVINDFANAGRQQRVVVQAEQAERMTPESVLRPACAQRQRQPVPLSAFVTTSWEEGPVQVARYNGYPSIRIAGDAAPGVSTGEAMLELERIAAELPEGMVTSGPGCRIRSGSPAGRRRCCSPWPSPWCSCCWWRSTRAGRSR
ncbi:efflux RND transporter permease subunit [Klebsiella pneumoniae]|nr:efflux RND transporter permease subunit [Klebsiella pneumoniae]